MNNKKLDDNELLNVVGGLGISEIVANLLLVTGLLGGSYLETETAGKLITILDLQLIRKSEIEFSMDCINNLSKKEKADFDKFLEVPELGDLMKIGKRL